MTNSVWKRRKITEIRSRVMAERDPCSVDACKSSHRSVFTDWQILCLIPFPQDFATSVSILSCRPSGSILGVIMAGPYLVLPLALSTCSGGISARAHWLMAPYYLNSPFPPYFPYPARKTTACWLWNCSNINTLTERTNLPFLTPTICSNFLKKFPPFTLLAHHTNAGQARF